MTIQHGSSEAGDGGSDGQGKPIEPLTVVVLALAKDEGAEILTEFQYWLTVGIVQRLCEFGDKKATADLRISPLGDFWELKLKGGYLKKINLRIYFAHVPEQRETVILKTYKKEEDRQVSPHVIITLEDRLEDYLAGRLQRGVSVYKRKPGTRGAGQ